MKRLSGVLLGGALLVAGCSGSAGSASTSATTVAAPRFEAAARACGNAVDVADGGKTIFADTKGKEDAAGLSVEQVTCVLQQLGVTRAVLQHMDSTRALDGQQTDEWDGIKARWTYHPNAGLGLTLVDSR